MSIALLFWLHVQRTADTAAAQKVSSFGNQQRNNQNIALQAKKYGYQLLYVDLCVISLCVNATVHD